MSYNFDVRYDAISTLALPGYTEREKSLFLTLAQERLVKAYYNIDGNKYKKGFENTEKRRKDLSKLVRSSVDAGGYPIAQPSTEIASSGRIDVNSRFFSLPEDFWLAITEWGYVNEDLSARPAIPLGERYDIQPITHDEYNAQRKNPFEKPICGKGWRLDIASNTGKILHEIVADKPIVQYHVRYIKKLRDIEINLTDPTVQVDSELNEMFHREIVDIAVELALETVSDRRFQSMKIENQNIE